VDGDGIRRLHSRAQPIQAEEAAADAGGTRWRLETTVPPHGCRMGARDGGIVDGGGGIGWEAIFSS
jgi:hypothetical protein